MNRPDLFTSVCAFFGSVPVILIILGLLVLIAFNDQILYCLRITIMIHQYFLLTLTVSAAGKCYGIFVFILTPLASILQNDIFRKAVIEV
jgi:hypothetical protein